MNLIKKLSTRSPWLFRINAGSCNGCDVELATTACISRYDVERLGCKYCGSPRHADIVLITGPLTARVKDKVPAHRRQRARLSAAPAGDHGRRARSRRHLAGKDGGLIWNSSKSFGTTSRRAR